MHSIQGCFTEFGAKHSLKRSKTTIHFTRQVPIRTYAEFSLDRADA
ncbi:MAG: hypothetical protein IPI77_17895 [Saprospiraceae bacterium]|nr:hypothetical protein [Saprospiraceae bacterium]